MTTVLSTIPSTPAIPTPAAITTEGGTTTEGTSTDPVVETPATEPAPAEPPKPDPDLEIAKKLDRVAKQEARARRAEAALQAREQRLTEKETSIDEKLAALDAALEDPIEYYLKKGKDPVDVAKRFARPVTEEEKRIAKLEAQYAKDAEERAKAAEDTKKQQTLAQRQREMRDFVGGITADEYPHLTSVYEAKQIPGLVTALVNRPHDPSDSESPTVLQVFRSTYDRDPTAKEIRDALEHEAELYAMSLMERLKPKSAPSQVTPATPPANLESTSLSNQHAANSPSGISRTKSREERMKELKEQLEAEAATSE